MNVVYDIRRRVCGELGNDLDEVNTGGSYHESWAAQPSNPEEYLVSPNGEENKKLLNASRCMIRDLVVGFVFICQKRPERAVVFESVQPQHCQSRSAQYSRDIQRCSSWIVMNVLPQVPWLRCAIRLLFLQTANCIQHQLSVQPIPYLQPTTFTSLNRGQFYLKLIEDKHYCLMGCPTSVNCIRRQA